MAWAAVASGAPGGKASNRLDLFARDLLTGSSATLTLSHWCATQHLAADPHIRAVVRRDLRKVASAATRRRLAAAADEVIAYRRVDLVCGERVLSQADNWYRPALLTPEMNRRLTSTDAPFGQVVAPLGFQRRTLRVSRPGVDASAANGTRPVLSVRALLTFGAGVPLALVQENYTPAILEIVH